MMGYAPGAVETLSGWNSVLGTVCSRSKLQDWFIKSRKELIQLEGLVMANQTDTQILEHRQREGLLRGVNMSTSMDDQTRSYWQLHPWVQQPHVRTYWRDNSAGSLTTKMNAYRKGGRWHVYDGVSLLYTYEVRCACLWLTVKDGGTFIRTLAWKDARRLPVPAIRLF